MASEFPTSASVVKRSGWSRHAGPLNVGVKLVGTALAFGLNIVLARSLPPDGFAQVSVALAWLALATALGSLSMPMILLRFVGEYVAIGRTDLAQGVVRFAVSVALTTSILVFVAVTLVLHLGWTTQDPQRTAFALLCAVLIVPQVLATVSAGLLQALEHAVTAELLGSALRSLLMLSALTVAWSAAPQSKLDPSRVLWLYLWVGVTVLIISGAWAYRLLRAALRSRPRAAAPVAYDLREWSRTGLALLAILLAAAAAERIDLLMLGWRGTGSDVASYAVAQRFAQIVLFAINAVGAVMAPRFVACLPMLRGGKGEDAQALVQSSGRLMLGTSVAAWITFAVLGPWLTGMFGTSYASAYSPLLILVGGQVAATLFGPGILVASLSHNARVAFVSLLLGMIVNSALNWLTVPWWGAEGAALATAVAMISAAAVAQVWLRRLLGLRIRPI